jgi:peptidoglycan-N-acetylglucosamine deacetylase
MQASLLVFFEVMGQYESDECMKAIGSVKRSLAGILPRSWLVTKAKISSDTVALTFDDGPHPEFTPQVLKALAKYGMKATFFMIGENIAKYPALVKQIVDEGHQLGNHSYFHREYRSLPLTQQLAEIDRTDALLENFDDHPRHTFRPPRGELSPSLLFALMRRKQTVAMWSYDSMDYQSSGVESIVRRFAEQPVQRGEIVLMHDDNIHTIKALEQLLPSWKQHGWSSVAFSALGIR